MKLSAVLALALLSAGSTAYADSFQVSYLSAGAQSSTVSNYVEKFDSASKSSSGTYTTSFNGSGVTGTYSGLYSFLGAGQYGGVGGSGQFITTGISSGTGSPYTLSLSSTVNYFGLWFSALDPGNTMTFYKDNTLLYTFSSADFLKAVGSCPGTAYCGNPNNGLDTGEQFAFINFYDMNGGFNKIVFAETGSYYGDFESDNHTIGNIVSTPGGTNMAVTPEPSSLALLGTGILGVAGAVRRRFFAV